MALTSTIHRGIEVKNSDGTPVCIGLYCVGFYRDLKPAALRLPYSFLPDVVDCPTCQALYPDVATVRGGPGLRKLTLLQNRK